MSSVQNLFAEVTTLLGYAPTAISAAQAGDAVAVRAYDGQAKMSFNWNPTTATALACKVQHSDTTTDGDFTDLSGATATISGTADAVTAIKFDVASCKAYVRGYATPTGGSTDGVLGMVLDVVKKQY